MKKKILSLAAVLLMLFAAQSGAYAEEFCAIGSCTAGDKINCYISDVAPNAVIDALSLPQGCEIATEDIGTAVRLYLRGTPVIAGEQMFSLAVSGAESYSILCSLEVLPDLPTIVQSGDVTCSIGERVQLSVGARVDDGGALSYQWFYGNGILIQDAINSAYSPDTSRSGVNQYYCEVTNTNNGITAAVNTDLFTVSVSEPVVKNIAVATLPAKLEYSQGDKLDTTGLSVLVTYTSGQSTVITAGFSVTPTDLAIEGTQTVQINYQGQKCSFQVSVKNAAEVVEGIGVVTLPSKTKYIEGDRLDTTGLSIRVYTDKGNYDVSSDLKCTPTVLDTAGSQTITVTYGAKTCTFKVNVEAKVETVQGISVSAKPAKLDYTVGDKLDAAGLTITVTTNKGTKDISTGFTCTPKLLTAAGQQEITVVYGANTCKFTVTVKAKATPSPSPTAKVSPSPTASVSPSPGAVTASPTHTPTYHESHETRAGNTLVKVIVVVSVLALGGLGAYVYMMQRKGRH